MKNFAIIFALFLTTGFLFVGCKDYDPKSYLTTDELRDTVHIQLCAWLEKRHEDADRSQRFQADLYPYYQRTFKNSYIRQYFIDPKTGRHHFLFIKREFRSLYPQDRRGIGGSFLLDDSLRITDMNQIFWTPMLREPQVSELGEELFAEMMEHGDVVNSFGDQTRVEWPNKNLIYDAKNNDWIWKVDTLAHKVRKKD